MGFTWAIDAHDTWIDHDYYLHVKPEPMTIEAGSRQRALPCVFCMTPAGSQPCILLVLVAGILCPNDNSHLNAAGMFCHSRCMPRKREPLIRAVVAFLQSAHH